MRHEIKKHSRTDSALTAVVLVLCTLMMFSSCRKEEDTIALIKIQNILGEPVAQAEVVLRAEPTPNGGSTAEVIDEVIQFTDASGEALFDFTESYEEGQAGFAVLNIEVTKDDTLTAEGIIKIDPEMVNEETLIIQ